MIEVKNLVKKYGNHMAIDHLNFKIEKGQVYGFLGPNGGRKVYHDEYYDGVSWSHRGRNTDRRT